MSGDLSVIMPLFNCAPWVEEAVHSVLDKADGLLELVVVDDGSTDASAEIVASVDGPVKLIRQPNAGVSGARNAGVRAAGGALIGFLDADDIWNAATPDPRRAAIAAGAEIAFGKVRIVAADPPREYAAPAYMDNLGGLIVRRDAFDRIGWFDQELSHGEDTDWVLRAREAGLTAVNVDDVSLLYRLRSGSLTQDAASKRAGLAKVLQRSLARRGKIGGAG